MRWSLVSAPTMLFLLPPVSCGAGDAKARTGIAVYDTRTPAAAVLPLAKNDWTLLPLSTTVPAFKGDAVLTNGRIVAVLRRKEAAIEIHAAKREGAIARARLRLQSAAGEPAVALERAALIENTKGGATLAATFRTAKGVEVAGTFRIKRGDVAVQVDPGPGAAKLRVESPGRFVVLPDFFADDITIDASRLPLSSVDLPSENFVLHPTANGDAIALCVFENRQQDVKVTLAGKGN